MTNIERDHGEGSSEAAIRHATSVGRHGVKAGSPDQVPNSGGQKSRPPMIPASQLWTLLKPT